MDPPLVLSILKLDGVMAPHPHLHKEQQDPEMGRRGANGQHTSKTLLSLSLCLHEILNVNPCVTRYSQGSFRLE